MTELSLSVINRFGGTQPRARLDDAIIQEYAEAMIAGDVFPPVTTFHVAPVAWAVADVLPEGAFLLGGRPKMGKSWLALSLALAVATGGRALGRAVVQQVDVLVLALEDNERRLQERLLTLLAGDERADVSRLTLRTDCPRLDKGGTLVVQSWLEAHPDARLVVVDTLAKVKPRRRAGGDAYADDYDAVQPFVELAKRHRVTLLIITHLRKLGMNEDVFDAITGTLGTTGGVDGALVLARERGRADAVLHVTGRDLSLHSRGMKPRHNGQLPALLKNTGSTNCKRQL